jgi:hypothetical protein
MIGEGTDALSRGEIHAHDLMNEYAHSVPLNLTALQRVPELCSKLEWTFGEDISIATTEQWFKEATQQFDYTETSVTWICDSPRASSLYALEELGMGRNKRGDVLRGVVLIPRLLTPEWFRRLSRVVVCFVVLPAGAEVWSPSCHEPLFVGLYFPLLRCSPWDWRRVPFCEAGVSAVQD